MGRELPGEFRNPRRALLRGTWFRYDRGRVLAESSVLLPLLGSRRQGAATRRVVSPAQGGGAGTRSDEHDWDIGRTPGSGYRYQSLASSVGRDRLGETIDTLMRTAVEHAGAERGLLILPRGIEQRTEAEANTSGETIIVRLGEASVAQAAMPESIVHYVVRTQESVILDDASAQPPFAADTYIRQQHARSILCLPLINQAKLIGVLYLENNLAPHVFTPTRIAVLKLLASQAAISLENTRLYSDLQEREAKI